MPSNCPLCGAVANIEYSDPAGDAPCPSCGHLLWVSAKVVSLFTNHLEGVLDRSPGTIDPNTRFEDFGVDSLALVEWVMEMEEELEISIPEDAAEHIETIADAIRYIEMYRRGKD